MVTMLYTIGDDLVGDNGYYGHRIVNEGWNSAENAGCDDVNS